MKINSIKEIKPSNKLYKKILAVIISAAVVVASFIYLNSLNDAAKQTVDVIRVKVPDGIPAQAVITEKDIEKYSIIKKEYTEDMMTYDKIKDVINKYSIYYLRRKSIIYKDQITTEKPIKTAWIYELGKTREVLTIPYNYLECGGDILIPGDKVRVRVSYETDETLTSPVKASAGSPPNYSMGSAGTSETKQVTKTEVLFDSITVKDLLNSRGHSVYEVYMEVLKLSEDKRQSVMTSEEFLNNIQPKSLVLEATPKQVDAYSKYKDKGAQVFTITILHRDKNVNILDQLPTVEKEVESWGAKKTN